MRWRAMGARALDCGRVGVVCGNWMLAAAAGWDGVRSDAGARVRVGERMRGPALRPCVRGRVQLAVRQAMQRGERFCMRLGVRFGAGGGLELLHWQRAMRARGAAGGGRGQQRAEHHRQNEQPGAGRARKATGVAR